MNKEMNYSLKRRMVHAIVLLKKSLFRITGDQTTLLVKIIRRRDITDIVWRTPNTIMSTYWTLEERYLSVSEGYQI